MAIRKRAWRILTLLLAGAVLCACATAEGRRQAARDLVRRGGWQWAVLPGQGFDLAAAWSGGRGGILTVYLEGDGLAYLDRRRPSSDPTPADPVALRMALAHLAPTPAAYLARPCQYVTGAERHGCSVAYWTGRRYAPEVVAAAGAALDELKRRAGAGRLALVGYSGGGALAVLLAARRADVASVVTVVANLDLGEWVRRGRFTPLAGSLDPAADATAVAAIPQVHLTGGRDDVVGPEVVRAFLARMPGDAPARLVEIPGFTHFCCWAEQWKGLQRRSDVGLPPPWILSGASGRP